MTQRNITTQIASATAPGVPLAPALVLVLVVLLITVLQGAGVGLA